MTSFGACQQMPTYKEYKQTQIPTHNTKNQANPLSAPSHTSAPQSRLQQNQTIATTQRTSLLTRIYFRL